MLLGAEAAELQGARVVRVACDDVACFVLPGWVLLYLSDRPSTDAKICQVTLLMAAAAVPSCHAEYVATFGQAGLPASLANGPTS